MNPDHPDYFRGLPSWDLRQHPHQPCGGCGRAHAYWAEKCRTVDEIHEEAMGKLPSDVQLTALRSMGEANYKFQKDCACPNLINGHWHGCIYA